MSRTGLSTETQGTILALLLLFLLSISSTCVYYSGGEEGIANVQIKRKEATVDGQSTLYLVYTKKEVYSVQDLVLYTRWDSSDAYNDIEEGACYNLSVVGRRWPLFSWYRNIITATKVKCDV